MMMVVWYSLQTMCHWSANHSGEEEAGLEDEVGLEEDPVIHELDVYITKSLGKLVLAQYPLRPTYKPYKTAVREGFRVRPVQHEVEVDMKLQTNPSKPPQVSKRYQFSIFQYFASTSNVRGRPTPAKQN